MSGRNHPTPDRADPIAPDLGDGPAHRRIATLERLLALDAPTVHDARARATDLIAGILSTDKVDAFVHDATADALVALGVSDTPLGRREREVGLDRLPLARGGLHVTVFRTGVPYATGRLDRDAGDLAGFARELGGRSLVVVPLEVAGERRGVLGAMSARPEAYSDEDRRFLEAVARWVGLIMGRVEAEEARRAADQRARLAGEDLERLRAVLEGLPIGVSLAEAPSGRPLLHNAAAVRLMRHPLLPSEAGDYSAYARYGAIHLDGRPYAPEEYPTVRAATRGEAVGPEVMRYRRGDGTMTTFSVASVPIRDAAGRVTLAVSTFEDIDARLRVEAQRDEVLRLATHDLRSPLTNVRGRAQLAQARADRGAVDPAWLRAQMDAVCASAGRMLAIIDEMADVARLQAGEGLDLLREPVDVAALARDASEEASGHRSGPPARVAVPERPVLVAGDRGRLGRVLQNVVGNAVKYSPPEAPVEVAVAEVGAEVVITVRDRGVGIPAADLPHLFTPYYRASTARGVAGSGLGLFGSKAIVEEHGGTIGVESAEGAGTTVTITLPRIAAGASDQPGDAVGP